MQRKDKLRDKRRTRKIKRVRKNLRGTPERPRLSVHRTSRQIYVQAIDDFNGVTLAASSSLDNELKSSVQGRGVEAAKQVGESVARRLSDKGIRTVVFDRGWYRYHGRVKAVAEGAREGGLEF